MAINGIAKRALATMAPAFVLEAMRDFQHRKDRYPRHHPFTNAVKGKMGLEVGGPTTWLFRYVLPVYQTVKGLDGVNFSTNTVWEGDIGRKGGRYYYYENRFGNQFISEATDLSQIQDKSYDFLLSSNCLEHIANPLKAVREWRRVVKPGGTLILFVPNKAYSFDRRRDFTTFDHLLSDYENDVQETDLSHLDDILALHDYDMDSGDREEFEARSLDNYHNRCLHHHVFSSDLLKQVIAFAGIEVARREEFCGNFSIIGKI